MKTPRERAEAWLSGPLMAYAPVRLAGPSRIEADIVSLANVIEAAIAEDRRELLAETSSQLPAAR